MVNTLWSLTTIKEKIIASLIALVIITSVVGYYKYQQYRIDDLSKQLSTSEISRQYDKIIYNIELEKAQKIISDQNSQIEEFRLDKTNYEFTLHEHEKELIAKKVKAQEDIQRELEQDNSLENQMRIMSAILEEFSNEE